MPELESEKVDYGLVRNLGTFNPIRVAFHEWIGIFRDLAQPGAQLARPVDVCGGPARMEP